MTVPELDYLCLKGHRRIAILTAYAHDTSIGKLRLDGYRRALKEHGIEEDPSLIVHMKGAGPIYTMQNGYDRTKELIASGTPFTALYAISDTIAIGACRAIFDSGLSVPEDISVAGFDGLDLAGYYHPSITTIEQPINEMALETSRMLFRLIQEKDLKERHIFQASLREGQSVMKTEDPAQDQNRPAEKGT